MIKNGLLECCDGCEYMKVSSCINFDFKHPEYTVISCEHMPICYRAKREKARKEKPDKEISLGDNVFLTGVVDGVKYTSRSFGTITEATVRVETGNGAKYLTILGDLLKKENKED